MKEENIFDKIFRLRAEVERGGVVPTTLYVHPEDYDRLSPRGDMLFGWHGEGMDYGPRVFGLRVVVRPDVQEGVPIVLSESDRVSEYAVRATRAEVEVRSLRMAIREHLEECPLHWEQGMDIDGRSQL